MEDRDRLLAARTEDDYLRIESGRHAVLDVIVDGSCVGWTAQRWSTGLDWSTVLGEDAGAVAEVAARLVAASEWRGRRTDGLTVDRVGALATIAAVPWDGAGEWDWWVTRQAPPAVPGEDTVLEISPGDPRLDRLLREWSPRRSVEADDRSIRRWAGLEIDGALVAAAADTRHDDDVPHLAGVVTDGAYRGRGFAAAVCAKLTRLALQDGAGLVTLSMYADNDPARKVYERLGFTAAHAFTSGRLLPSD